MALNQAVARRLGISADITKPAPMTYGQEIDPLQRTTAARPKRLPMLPRPGKTNSSTTL